MSSRKRASHSVTSILKTTNGRKKRKSRVSFNLDAKQSFLNESELLHNPLYVWNDGYQPDSTSFYNDSTLNVPFPFYDSIIDAEDKENHNISISVNENNKSISSQLNKSMFEFNSISMELSNIEGPLNDSKVDTHETSKDTSWTWDDSIANTNICDRLEKSISVDNSKNNSSDWQNTFTSVNDNVFFEKLNSSAPRPPVLFFPTTSKLNDTFDCQSPVTDHPQNNHLEHYQTLLDRFDVLKNIIHGIDIIDNGSSSDYLNEVETHALYIHRRLLSEKLRLEQYLDELKESSKFYSLEHVAFNPLEQQLSFEFNLLNVKIIFQLDYSLTMVNTVSTTEFPICEIEEHIKLIRFHLQEQFLESLKINTPLNLDSAIEHFLCRLHSFKKAYSGLLKLTPG